VNLVLIGYRGTGKSTVARLVAERLGWKWVDADVELERRAGKSIARIFADDGETAFRDLESDVLRDLAAGERTVVAAGGGVVLREANRHVLRGMGHVAWLKANVTNILERVAADVANADRRPNLTTAGGRAEVESLLAERMPLYRDCADLEVETDGKSPESIAEEIVDGLKLVSSSREPA